MLFAAIVNAQSKRFCNLTPEDVRIDSVLPHVSYRYHLPENHEDSVYTVQLKYPEFLDMSEADVAAYKALTVGEGVPAEMPQIDVATVSSRKQKSLVASFCPVVFRDGKYKFVVSYMVEFASSPKPANMMRKAPGAGTMRYAENSVLAKGRWGKIRVSTTGIHELTADVIRRAGFTDLSKVRIFGYGGNMVPETLTGEYLVEHDDLKEVPTCTVGGRKLFFANGPVSWSAYNATTFTQNPYSDYGYYFITQDDTAPKTLAEEAFLNASYPSAADYHDLLQKEEFSWMEGGRKMFEKNSITQGATRSYDFKVAREADNVKLTVCSSAFLKLAGKSTTNTYVEVSINDSVLGKQIISVGTYDCANSKESVWTVKHLRKDNVIKLKNIDANEARLGYVMVTYNDPKEKPSLQTDAFPKAEYVYNITNQNHHADKACDMTIIIPTSQHTLLQAEELKAIHEKNDGMSVRIVPADELYNEFSSGTPDISAYKRYMKMQYDRAQSEAEMPKYLLLFGDCVWDNRLRTPVASAMNADNLLLCYESENSFSEKDCYVSDDFIGILDDGESLMKSTATGIPDIAVGRLPVSSVNEAKVALEKIKSYIADANTGNWHNTVMFLGDDGNNNIHMKDINTAAENTLRDYPEFYVRKVMWDAFSRESASTGHRYPEVTSIIKKQQAEGALLIDYGGHGSPTAISHEYVLTINDFAQFRGKNYPLWITASCNVMPFDGASANIGETALLNSNGGAIAFYGTTRTVLSNYNKFINTIYVHFILGTDKDGNAMTFGEANRLTKDSLVTAGHDKSVNKLQYSLLGDPALRIARPQLKVVIDSINGIAPGGREMPNLKAGSIAKVNGHIAANGQKLSSFNGLANLLVRDTKQHVVCKLNNTTDEGADTAFDYYDRTNVLFQGADSVRSGEFSFIFAVPRDINYADGTGMINVYASSDDKKYSAHGAFESFRVGGSETVTNDSIGPSVFCYLNNPSFVNGGSVNSTPFFVAEIKDEDGINASGSGIGHDLQLVVDGQPSLTFSLNDNFQFDFGSYTSGQTYYVLPALAPGKHSLRFRVWDILNNSTTTTLDFNVQAGQEPTIGSIYATPNPASDSVTFVVSHDRPGAALEVNIEVMDAAGRLIWATTNNETVSDSNYSYKWDLTLAGGGKLQTGVYLYRVRMRSDGSDYASLAKKLVVVRR